MIALITGVLGALGVILYFYLTRNYSYWQKRKIPCVEGALPGFGNVFSLAFVRVSNTEYFRKIYNDFKGRSMVGFYNFTSPSLIILEPELVKTVLQSNFTSFHENAVKIDPDVDPLFSNNPFFTYGDKWTSGRKQLTYAFSSMRLKTLLESVKLVCEKLENFVDKKLSKVGVVELELKDMFSRYTAQVVASAGFGVDGHCFDEKQSSMSFWNIGQAIFEPTIRNKIAVALLFFIPSLNKLLRISFIPWHVDRFFRSLVTDMMEQRRTDAIPRNDFLQMMVDLERMNNEKFNTEILASHGISFFIDGYQTSSVVLSFIGFQLAVHSEVQEKLRQEVTSVLARYDNAITYEALREMTYMDQVITETQRLAPVLGTMNKLCTQEFELKGSDGLTCRLQPGTEVVIPVYGLQRDSRYWSNPEVYDPERFNPEKKQSIEKFAHLPFGEGPRICVGMRMALLQMKACLSTLLMKYRFELSPKTQVPLYLIPGTVLPTPKGGLWIFIRRL